MKKIIITMLIIFMFPISVSADELITIDDFDFSNSARILKENGYEDIHTDEILKELLSGNILGVIKDSGKLIKNKTVGDVSFVEKTLLNLLIIIIISAFFTNLANVFAKNNISETAFYICYLSIVSVIITIFETISAVTVDFVTMLVHYMSALIPTYFISVALIGQASATGFYHIMLVVIGLVEYLFLNIIIPMIKMYLAIGLVNSISKENLLSRMCDLIKRIIKFANKFFIGAISGVNLIQGLILPSVDIAKNTTIKRLFGSVPGIGNGVDAYSGIMLGSVNLIKNTIGGFAILIILILCIVPYVKMQIYRVSFGALSAVIEPVCDKRIISGLQIVTEAIGLLLEILVVCALLFIISIAIICLVTRGEV